MEMRVGVLVLLPFDDLVNVTRNPVVRLPPQNKFFITCLDSVFKYKIQELGGVRVITH